MCGTGYWMVDRKTEQKMSAAEINMLRRMCDLRGQNKECVIINDREGEEEEEVY